MTADKPFNWSMPVEVQFGPGCTAAVAEHLDGAAAVVMAFEPATALGWRAQWSELLGPRLLTWVEVPDGLSSMSRCREFAPQVWPLLESNPGAVLIAIGGGTTLDIAKVLRCRPVVGRPTCSGGTDARGRTHPAGFDPVAAALRSLAPWPALDLAPLWMVPTTAGTGSEVTRWATVWDTDELPARKRSFDEPFGFAQKAFIDPLLTHSCPTSVTRDTALDALSHALEALWNRHANPFSDVLAVSAARKVLTWLPAALRDPDDAQARQSLALAALEAGFAFSQTRTALAHALSYAVTLEHNVPHGLACALWLPTACRLAQGCDSRVDALLAQVFGDDRQGASSVAPMTAADRLQSWLLSIGVSSNPVDYGVHDAPERVALAMGSARGRNFIAAQG